MTTISPAMTSPLFTEAWNMTSSTPETAPTPSNTFAFHFYTFATSLLPFYHPVILCVGTLGNVMTVVIMKQMTSSEDSTIHIYFISMAVVDLVFLWSIVPIQIVHFNWGYDFKTVHGVVCKIITWLYTGGGTVSCWYLVCMTVHRAMSVVWPHRVNSLCTRRTVVIMLAAVTGVVAALYAHYLAGYDTLSLDNGLSYKCTLASPDYVRFHSNVFVYLELLLYCALPFVMIVLSNSVLVWRLLASARGANRRLAAGSGSQANNREKAANSVTLTVMTVSLAFLVLTLPSSVTFIIHHLAYTGHTETSQSAVWLAFASSIVCTLLSHTNHAVNFYLYCLTGRRFREEFLKLLCCGRAGPRLVQGMPRKEAASR